MAGRAFAFFWVILIGLVKAQNPLLNACNAQHMQTCQAEFNDELQIGASLGILTYPDLRTAIEQKFASGMAYGLLQTCAAFKNYKFCYANSNEYFSCAENPLGLLIQGFNPTGLTQFHQFFRVNGTSDITRDQAFGYTKIWNQLDFVCGAGFSIFANSEDCASSVFGNRTTDLRDCDNAFNTNSQQNPDRACSYVEIATNCYQTAFWKACQKPEIAWWGCNYERVGTQLNYPQCTQIYCTFHEILN